MQISSAVAAGRLGLHRAEAKLDRAAETVAKAPAADSDPVAATADLVDARAEFSANLATLRTADAMTRQAIDILV